MSSIQQSPTRSVLLCSEDVVVAGCGGGSGIKVFGWMGMKLPLSNRVNTSIGSRPRTKRAQDEKCSGQRQIQKERNSQKTQTRAISLIFAANKIAIVVAHCTIVLFFASNKIDSSNDSKPAAPS